MKSGKSDEVALQEILSEYKEESEDIDCKYDFFLALVDTLWKKGRLPEEIRAKALQMIDEDKVSERWQSERIRKEYASLWEGSLVIDTECIFVKVRGEIARKI